MRGRCADSPLPRRRVEPTQPRVAPKLVVAALHGQLCGHRHRHGDALRPPACWRVALRGRGCAGRQHHRYAHCPAVCARPGAGRHVDTEPEGLDPSRRDANAALRLRGTVRRVDAPQPPRRKLAAAAAAVAAAAAASAAAAAAAATAAAAAAPCAWVASQRESRPRGQQLQGAKWRVHAQLKDKEFPAARLAVEGRRVGRRHAPAQPTQR
mmetsp:Transcript_17002/g.53794  ORF Transcript_17002/g.53794 Transcript_17002/m.53794 type:complete len:210 (+) Transcript_17002:86-715(+)